MAGKGKDEDVKLVVSALVDGLENVAKLTGELKELEKSGKEKIPDNTKGLRDGADKTSGAVSRLGKDAKTAGAELKEAGSAASSAEGMLKRLGRTITATAAAYLSLRGIKSALMGILGTAKDFEQFRAQLDQAMGSIEAGEQATKWIKDFTAETPYSLDQVTESFLKLKAFGIDPMDGSYEALANQAAALGGSQETLNGIILAAGQAWAKQKLQGEEILQLVERGVPVWDLLTQATGKSVLELQKMSQAGQLGRKEIALLIEQMGRAADGSLAAQAETLGGLWSRIASMWTEFTAKIAESGLAEYVKDTLRDLIARFKQLEADGTLQRWAKAISDAFVSLGEAIKRVSTTSVGDLKTFGDRVAETLGGVSRALQFTGASATLFVTGLKAAFNSAVMAVAAFFSKVTELSAKTWQLFGFDGIAENARLMAQSFNDTFDEYAAKLAENNATIKQAASDLADSMIAEAKRGAEGSQQAHAEAAELTGEALVAAVEMANQQTQLLRDKLDEINRSVATAVANTEGAWKAFYAANGTAQAVALENLNKAINEENKLRSDASKAALEYNDAVAKSEQLIAELVEERGREQAEAAQQAREELQRLGVDLGLAFDGISSGAATSIAALKTVAEEIKKIGPESDKAARAFEQGVTTALRNVSTAEEFDSIRAQIKELRDQGLIDHDAATRALGLIRQKAEELNNTTMNDGAEDLAKSLLRAGQIMDDINNKEPPGEKGFRASATAADALKSQVEAVRAALGDLSSQALAAFDQGFLGRGALNEMDEARAKLADMAQKISDLQQYSYRLNAGGIGDWMNDMQIAAAQASKAFYQQKVEFLSLVEAVESGSMSLQRLNDLSRSAKNQFDLLDDTDLSRLNSAIDTARQKIESLNDSAAATLANLRNELDQMEGDLASVQQRTYEQQRQQLLQQLKEAQESGAKDAARDAQEALKVAEQVHRRKMQQIKDEEAARRKAAQEEAARARAEAAQAKLQTQQANTPANIRQQQTQTVKTVNVRLGGQTVQVIAGDEDKLIKALEAARRTA